MLHLKNLKKEKEGLGLRCMCCLQCTYILLPCVHMKEFALETQKNELESEFKVCRVTSENWEKLRDVRTQAIIDSPQAFGDTIEQTLARTEDEWKRWTKSNIYAIEDNDKYIATVTWRKHPDYGDYIVGVWTDPEYRGKGLNAKLFERVFNDAQQSGVKEISLHVNIDQQAAVQSYQKLGFKIVGTVMQKQMGDEELHDEYFMTKDCATV